VNDAVASAATSESFRYIILRCRVREARETHAVAPDGALHVSVVWS
jgi:hypothetical protein